jgi:arabinofuranan 3-O-arabinosyltransferase
MASYEISPAHGAGAKLAHPVELFGFALIVINVVAVLAFARKGLWIDTAHVGDVPDFVGPWAVGRLVDAGHAADAYDWAILKPTQESVVGHFDGYLGWRYPPPFFFVCAVLALFPYTVAFLAWIFATFAAYLAAIRAIVGDRVGYFLAAACPAVLANFMVGQNGFLSAGLIGGTLVLLEERPLCSGVLLGLLSYKPHLGLLFPVALVAGGRWRAFSAAIVTVMLLSGASWAAFGTASWQAFLPSIGGALGSEGAAYLGKMQSAFGLTRAFAGSEALGWTVQIATALAAAAAIAVLWRSRAAYDIKAAALGTAVLLATPHLLIYDLVILAVPVAFLFRLGRRDGFLKHELSGIGIACLLILIYPFVPTPVGFIAVLIVAALVARRALTPQRFAAAP